MTSNDSQQGVGRGAYPLEAVHAEEMQAVEHSGLSQRAQAIRAGLNFR